MLALANSAHPFASSFQHRLITPAIAAPIQQQSNTRTLTLARTCRIYSLLTSTIELNMPKLVLKAPKRRESPHARRQTEATATLTATSFTDMPKTVGLQVSQLVNGRKGKGKQQVADTDASDMRDVEMADVVCCSALSFPRTVPADTHRMAMT